MHKNLAQPVKVRIATQDSERVVAKLWPVGLVREDWMSEEGGGGGGGGRKRRKEEEGRKEEDEEEKEEGRGGGGRKKGRG